MLATLKGPYIDFAALSPLIALLGGAALVLLVGMARSRTVRTVLVPALTLVVLAAATGLSIWQWNVDKTVAESALKVDNLALTLDMILAVGAAAAVLLAWRSRAADEAAHGEFHALVLSSVAGMSVLASAQNIVALFVGFELLSIPLYVLCASEMRREHSLESGLKYLIVGSVGSAMLVYGLALIYGATGQSDFTAIAGAIHGSLATSPLTAHRDRAGRRRPVLQGLDRAVPPVDARRLRGRPDAGHGVHGGNDEGRSVRRLPAALRRRADRRAHPLGARARGARDDHDHRRQRRRPRPDIAQADARLLLGGAGRLHAHRRDRGHETRRLGDGLLPRRLHDHEHGCLRGDRRAGARNRPRRLDRIGRRNRPRPTVARMAPDARDARPRRDSCDRGLLREVLSDQRRGGRKLHLARSRDRDRLDDLARLLPAGRRGDLDARVAASRGRPATSALPALAGGSPELPEHGPCRAPGPVRGAARRGARRSLHALLGIFPEPLLHLAQHAGNVFGSLP